jgi:hypothetical protein
LIESHDRAVAELRLSYELRIQAICNEVARIREQFGLPPMPCPPEAQT